MSNLFASGGWAIVSEAGPEIVKLPGVPVRLSDADRTRIAELLKTVEFTPLSGESEDDKSA